MEKKKFWCGLVLLLGLFFLFLGVTFGKGSLKVWSDKGGEREKASISAQEGGKTHQPEARLAPALQEAAAKGGALMVVITVSKPEDKKKVAETVREGGGTLLRGEEEEGTALRAHLPAASLKVITQLPEIIFVEPYTPPQPLNDRLRDVTGASLVTVPGVVTPPGLTGAGQVVAVADSGLDQGSLEDIHPDLKSTPGQKPKVIMLKSWAKNPSAADPLGHGTHLAATVVGTGAASAGKFRGVAPGASLYFQALLNPQGQLDPPADLKALFKPAYEAAVRIHVDGWGGETNAYLGTASQTDSFMREHADFLVIFGAGNRGPASHTLTPEANSKNALVVGASQNPRPGFGEEAWAADAKARFSSRGATGDGRLKPDLLAPGTAVVSARSRLLEEGNFLPHPLYTRLEGTSMAAAVAGGATVLLREYFQKKEGLSSPSAALLKAALINGARSLGNGPSEEGFGLLDLAGTVLSLQEKTFWFEEEREGIGTGETRVYRYEVTSSDTPLKVTLAWTDPPAAPGAKKTLVNNLDLTVTSPGGLRYLGNHFLASNQGEADALNNVEQVYLPHPECGTYTITVRGTNVTTPATLGSPRRSQDFALVFGQPLRRELVVKVTGKEVTLASGEKVALSPERTKNVFGDALAPVDSAHLFPGADFYLAPQAFYLFARSWETPGVQVLPVSGKLLWLEVSPYFREGGFYLHPQLEANLFFNGEQTTAEKIPVGVEVKAVLNPSSQMLGLVQAAAEAKEGFLALFDGEKLALWFLREREPYFLSPKAAISFADQLEEGSRADLPFGTYVEESPNQLLPGVKVRLLLSPTRGEVIYLAVKRSLIVGTVAEVNPAAGKITLDTGTSYSLFPGSRVVRDGKEASWAELKAGDHIQAVLLPETKEIIFLAAASRVDYGKAIYLNTKERTLFFQDYLNWFRTCPLAPDVKVRRWGLAADLSVLKPGDWVRLTFDPTGKEIRCLEIAELAGEEEKTFAAYDSENSLLRTREGENYTLSKRTLVTKNGYPVTPADLFPGEKLKVITLATPDPEEKALAAVLATTRPGVVTPQLKFSLLSKPPRLLLTGSTSAGRLYFLREGEAREIVKVNPGGYFQEDFPLSSTEVLGQIVAVETATGGVAGQLVTLPALPAPKNLKDLAGHWGAAEIQTLLAQGIVNGYPDGTFRPERPVTRAELAVILVQALGWSSPKPPPLFFADTAETPAWAKEAIGVAQAQKLFFGYPDGTFRPQQSLTREEAAVVFGRVLEAFGFLPPPPEIIPWEDKGEISLWAREISIRLFAADVFKGRTPGRFVPRGIITRAEACVALSRLLQQLAQGGVLR